VASSIGGILSFVLLDEAKSWWAFWRWFTKKPKHVKACANNKYNLITLGGVNEVVLIVLTSVTDQKWIKSNLYDSLYAWHECCHEDFLVYNRRSKWFPCSYFATQQKKKRNRCFLSMNNIALSGVYSNLLLPIEFIFARDCNVIKWCERAKRDSFD
jgi:hypothetical protein